MTKQEQIEEMNAIMSNCLYDHCEDCKNYNGHFCIDTIGGKAEALYNAGYRKTFTSDLASDTQKAFKEGYMKGLETNLENVINAIVDKAFELLKEYVK